MFEVFQDSIRRTAEAFQEKYDSFSDSMEKLNNDLMEIRDLFITIKNIIFSVFSFIGQETTVLLFCTMMFLFVFNLIPFLFLGKKARYFIGIGFGVYLSVTFGYTARTLLKYVLIMLSPMILEYLLALFFKTTGRSLWFLVKKGARAVWRFFRTMCRKIWKKLKKDKESEKQVLKQ